MELKTQLKNNLDNEQIDLLSQLLNTLNNDQKIWLGGYLSGINESTGALLQLLGKQNDIPTLSPSVNTQSVLKILYGTRSGNAQKVALKANKKAEALGLNVRIENLSDYNPKELKKEKNLLIVVSTDGEGEPPVAAEEFYKYIHSKKAPALTDLKYSVLALGDSSYQHFCKTGKDIDEQLNKLGGQAFYERIDCDLDFEEKAGKWIDESLEIFAKENKESSSLLSIGQSNVTESKSEHTQETPFQAPVLDKVLLNGRGSSKETFHYEFAIEDSGISYTPGDSLGVYSTNDTRLVDAVLNKTKLNENEKIVVGKDEKTLREALTHNYELTRITPPLVKSYAQLANSSKLDKLVADTNNLEAYLWGRDVLDLLEEYPVSFDTKTLFTTLRKLQPRLYSIASSYNANPDEVHITVAKVNYYRSERDRFGVCSGFLSDRMDDDAEIPIYIDENIGFRLPTDPSTPIIMIGAGTGVAPYRAFLQERELAQKSGKSWLFFGERNFNTDFIYQTEWQKFMKKGVLSNLNVAFSRDQKQKVYVQNKLIQQKKDVYKWIQEGAHIYVCGDKNTMAKDVRAALLHIIETEGGYKSDRAQEYLKQLRKENRFQEDVY
jgi:sulfite reductase (NADPH) flavoprotein alpha-component